MNCILRLLFCLVLCFVFVASAEYVNGYTRHDGTYVSGYYRSDRNSTNSDNYSTEGNTNPYTGTRGTIARDYSAEAHNYGSGHVIETGPRGGQYYINDYGNKVYVPKQW